MKRNEKHQPKGRNDRSNAGAKRTVRDPQKSKAGRRGGGEQTRRRARREMDLPPQKIFPLAKVSFDWKCPKCGSVGQWKKPWSPEGKQPLCWTCAWCKVPSNNWIWVPKAGWHKCVTDEDRKQSCLPVLDYELRWMFVCECTAVHRPNGGRFVKGEDGEPRYQAMEPTQFKVSCECGRSRIFRLRDGHWQQESFEYHPKEPAQPSAPAKPPEDLEPLTKNEFTCGYCGDSFTIEARSQFRHVCERCGHVTKLAKHHAYRCGKCGDEFTWRVGDEPWCLRCQKTENIIDTGEVVWERPPSTSGSLRIGGELADQLWGREGKDGLFQAYEKATKEGRAAFGYEVWQMANHMLSFLVQLADKFEDYDSVRWLAKHAELGKRRVPDDDSESIEDKLTRPDKPRAAREWNDVTEWIRKSRHHVSKSRFSTHMRRLAEAASMWRWGFQIVRDARADHNLRFEQDAALERRKQSWGNFLEAWGIKSELAIPPIPYPARYDEEGEDAALIREVLIPIVRWWQRKDPLDYAKEKYPKDTSNRALEREIRKALRLTPAQPPSKKEPPGPESLADG